MLAGMKLESSRGHQDHCWPRDQNTFLSIGVYFYRAQWSHMSSWLDFLTEKGNKAECHLLG